MNGTDQLDTFETALLAELRREVAEHPAPAPAPRRQPRRRLRIVAAGAVATAAATVAAVGLTGGGPTASPAYAVEQDSDGDVTVIVHRLDDAAGLEQALADQGIDADVSYEPHGPGDGNGYTFKVPHLDDSGSAGQDPTTSGPASIEDACGPPQDLQAAATLQQQGDDWVLRIPAGSPLLDGRPVAISTSVDGGLVVFYAGLQPGSYCGVFSFGTPPS
ncbi:MAG: hypothetical protein QOD98_806 [Nocardioidaceae bacterium]|jgi:hypothetical protein|nr:hypothetical protein [Nocardioidaceae bacterium]